MKLSFTLLFIAFCTVLQAQYQVRKPSFYYQPEGNRPERMIRSVKKNNLWVEVAKHEYIYNQYDFTTSGYILDTVNSTWKDDFTLVESYNENGDLYGEVYSKNGIGVWTTISWYNDDKTINLWRYLEKNEDNTNWNFVSQVEYKHYTDADSVVYLELKWNAVEEKWDSLYRTRKAFKSTGKDSMDYVCVWDTTDNGWKFSHRNWYTYYDDGSYTINKNILEPSGFYRTVFATDIGYYNGLYVSKTFSRYNGTPSFQFINCFRFYYDESNRLSYQYEEVYDTIASLWIPTIMDQFIYPVETAENSQPVGDELLVYPNPATDHLWLNTQNSGDEGVITLFNMHGERMLHQKTGYGIAISVESLPKGLYVYEIDYKDKIKRGKIILQ